MQLDHIGSGRLYPLTPLPDSGCSHVHGAGQRSRYIRQRHSYSPIPSSVVTFPFIFFFFYAAYRTTVRRSESGRGGGGGEPSFLDYDPDGQLLEKTTATVDRLWSITEDLNILYRDNWTHLARNEMRHYQAEIVHALRRIMLEERYSIRQTWSFPMSLLYALTLVTTIGQSRAKFNPIRSA